MSCIIVRPCRNSGIRCILFLSCWTDLFFSWLWQYECVFFLAHGPITQAVSGRSCFPAVVLCVSRPLWLSASPGIPAMPGMQIMGPSCGGASCAVLLMSYFGLPWDWYRGTGTCFVWGVVFCFKGVGYLILNVVAVQTSMLDRQNVYHWHTPQCILHSDCGKWSEKAVVRLYNFTSTPLEWKIYTLYSL